jgi:hypothetical protein
VDQHHVGIAAARGVERLPGATRTSMPVCFVNAGSRCLKSPDCSVDVVDATTMKGDCAHAAPQASHAAAAAISVRREIGRKIGMAKPGA